MKFAMFQTPFMRPARSPREVFDWAVTQAEECDRAGFTEYWIGEHATMTYESIPNPELVIAAAARGTENIKLCPGAHLLPYHHPGTLAVQVSWLTHVTQGRYILGIGAGAYPSDGAIRGLKDLSENHRMTVEALDIMQRVWKAEPFHFEGEYWKAGYPERADGHEWRDIRPFGGKVDIAMAGLSPNSPTLKFAGRNGYLSLSVYAGEAAITNHWETYENAAREAGLSADRSDLHVVRDVLVADTDAEARKLAVEGGLGQAWLNYLLPVYKRFGLLQAMLPDHDVNDVDVDTLLDHVWIVGSPDTVADKLGAICDRTGGWGTTMVYGHDYTENPEPWNRSLELLTSEVAPKLQEA
ncbi:LLM class flavin-dependent oxidoreductase [Amycolatopsis echigonensis]|uniref:LLM class flavin-dependent oxidoreductase n=1 Tax=Amycolatopsis echigonensis TaxID=2576905 RepID=A0A8E1W5I2_9PSEU|nr:LLM class flavin-dependent oxidoreductase [Amycolatopsis echigonensis]MBB2504431.1 LLM class flavin-dependent oxidoreductase [Amycolatopsis echigonensis]